MPYRIYFQKAYAVIQKNPMLWLLGGLASASGLGIVCALFLIVHSGSGEWIESFKSTSYPWWGWVLAVVGLGVISVLGRMAKVIMVLHLAAQLRVKRVPFGFRRASDATMIEPEDTAAAGVLHRSLVQESKHYFESAIAIHAVTSLLIALSVGAIGYSLLYMAPVEMRVKLTITSLIGFAIIVLVVSLQGMLATLFSILYQRPMKVAMNVAGDMMVMYLQRLLALGIACVCLVVASGFVLFGAYETISRISNAGASAAVIVVLGLIWFGALNAFVSAIGILLFGDLVKPEVFETAKQTVIDSASSKT